MCVSACVGEGADKKFSQHQAEDQRVAGSAERSGCQVSQNTKGRRRCSLGPRPGTGSSR